MTAPQRSRLPRTPRKVHIEITSKCNLRCIYCSFFNNDATPRRDLPTEEWLAFFAECGRLAIMSVVLSGGEAFSRKDLAVLLDGIVSNRMRFSILSNGALINDDIAAHVAATGRCDSVQISVDGARAETHDRARGAGSFDGAIRGLKILLRHKVPATVRYTIHRHNVDDLEAAAKFLLEDLGLPGFSTNAASPVGSCREIGKDLMLDVADKERAMETLSRLDERYPGRLGAAAGPSADLKMWNHMLTAAASNEPASLRGGYLTACGCPNGEISVRADGAIVPCNLLDHIELGWINKDALDEVWRDHPRLEALRNRISIPLSDFTECRSCSFQPYCTGNCPALAHGLTGEIDCPSAEGCLRRFLAEGGNVPPLHAGCP